MAALIRQANSGYELANKPKIKTKDVWCNCCVNCCACTESQRQCPLHSCWRTTWTTWSERSPAYAAQLHTHDLFWANLKVQLHLPPLKSLDLAWNLEKMQIIMHMYFVRDTAAFSPGELLSGDWVHELLSGDWVHELLSGDWVHELLSEEAEKRREEVYTMLCYWQTLKCSCCRLTRNWLWQ